jgi:TrmH family RNA methyltransferase
MKALLDNVSIVLVGIRNPGNIGSAARAMKNMGVNRLVLVNPVPYDTPEAYNLAWGAEELVRDARVCKTLDEAIGDCGLVVGTTRRKGRRRRPIMPLRAVISKVGAATMSNRVAVLFGREDKGLSNEELARCQLALSIPTSRKAPSLNVAQAVMVVCYELFGYALGPQDEPAPALVPQVELLKLYSRMEKALALIGYGDRGSRKVLTSVMRTLRRILGRNGLADDELRALHGICHQVEMFVAHHKNRG